MVELLRTKLFIPQTRPHLVSRPRLLERLNSGLDKKLTLVAAPAGFGKTTLVAAWIKQFNLPAAWLSLDDADNDLQRFLTYLTAALQIVDEGIGVPLLNALQSPQPPAMEKVMTALLNEAALRIDPLILVLDDYQQIAEPAIFKMMELWLHHQPPQLKLLLITREDPALPLAKMRAQDQLTEIRARDLRFTRVEVDAFLKGVMGLELSDQDVSALEERTEGWAVGLQLAGLSMQKKDDLKEFIADFSGSHRHILDYLLDEVIQKQPEGTRTFLLQTSILDRLFGPLCDALTGRNDSVQLLAHLESTNLFVIPLDEERRWYRYHHLFSDLLRSQLNQTAKEWIPELHRRASRWHEENGDIQAAINHALQGADLTQASHLIEQHVLSKLYHGQVAMVLGWFDRLPEAVLESAPILCIGKAWALALMHRGSPREGAKQALDAAYLALDRVYAGKAQRDLVSGHAASIRAFLLPAQAGIAKNTENMMAFVRESQRLLPEDEKAIRSVNAMNMGYGYLALADLEAARLAYQQALEDGLSGGNYYAAIYGPINLILIECLRGCPREALQLCETNIARFNQILAGQNFPPIGALYVLKGMILLEYDCMAEAERVLAQGLDLIRWTGESMVHRSGYTALARLRAIRGDRDAVREAVQALDEIFPEDPQYSFALRHSLGLRHWPDDPDTEKDANKWLAQAGIEFSEVEVINSVDPNSTAYFESIIKTAQVMARLAKKMTCAYPLEKIHSYLERQQDFAESNGFVSWVVEIAITRTLLFWAEEKGEKALETLTVAINLAAPTGLFRIFLDECDPLQSLLEELKPKLSDVRLIIYVNRLLVSMHRAPVKPKIREGDQDLLSKRELEVLGHLARGLSYEEIGQQIFLSLNTIQFHVKNIYRKLLVNKRLQAVEKAREMQLI
jgi:LuxR family transcriptional regulator, maltose regulon positive regulatory protein